MLVAEQDTKEGRAGPALGAPSGGRRRTLPYKEAIKTTGLRLCSSPLRTPQHQLLATAHAPEQDHGGPSMAGEWLVPFLWRGWWTSLLYRSFPPQHFKISPSPLKTRARDKEQFWVLAGLGYTP